MIGVYPLITKARKDYIDKERTLIYMTGMGIPNVNEFGRCCFLQSRPPINAHYHQDSFELCYHISGRQIYRVNGKDYETKGGDIFVTYPNEIHSTGASLEEKSSFYYFSFNCMPRTKRFLGLDDITSDYITGSLLGIKNRHFKGNDDIKRMLDSIMTVYFSDSPIKRTRIRGILLEFFAQIIELEQKGNREFSETPDDIMETVDYICEHTYEDINISMLARSIGLSESRFKEKFRRYTGVTPNDYILKSKIQLSKDMMRYTDLSITEISNLLNFSSSQYFATVFKRFENFSPKKYKTAIRRNWTGKK